MNRAVTWAVATVLLMPVIMASCDDGADMGETFVVRSLSSDEDLGSLDAGVIFLDTGSGDLELVTTTEPHAQPFHVSRDNRFVFVDNSGGLLLDRATGAVTSLADLAGRPVTGGGGILALGGLIVVELDDQESSYLILNSEFDEVGRFALPPGDGRPLASWVSETSPNALLFNGSFYVLDLTSGSVTNVPFDSTAGRDVLPQLLDNGFALATYAPARGVQEPVCEVATYSWSGVPVLRFEFHPCGKSNFGRRIDVSPDGRMAVKWSEIDDQFAAGPGFSPILGAVYVYDLLEGASLSRVNGAAMPALFGADSTIWAKDSSALVVATQDGNFMVGPMGEWLADEPPSHLPIPSTAAPQREASQAPDVIDGGVDSSSFVLAVHSVRLEDVRAWHMFGAEAAYSILRQQGDWGAVAPIGAAAIEQAPFSDEVLIATGEELCVPILAQPSQSAMEVGCVSIDTTVSLQASPVDDSGRLLTVFLQSGDSCEAEDAGCTWVSIRTADGANGWLSERYLRWRGAEAPLAD